MTLKQLEAFYWAATCASFAVAAERLHLSVSSLSKRIAELEEALGQPLFDRSGHKAALTEAGQRLLPQAGDMLASAERIRASVAQSAGLVGRCRFGVGELTALTWLPRLIGVVRAAHPGLVLEPYVDIGQVLEQRVADGELDFAVIAGRSSRVGIASATIGQAAFPGRGACGAARRNPHESRAAGPAAAGDAAGGRGHHPHHRRLAGRARGAGRAAAAITGAPSPAC